MHQQRLPFRRFVVSDRSMEPTLVNGQALITVRSDSAKVGELRVFQHPYRPGFWLVKRVAETRGSQTMWVLSDNVAVETLDSRELGSLPVDGSFRVLWALPTWLVRIDRG